MLQQKIWREEDRAVAEARWPIEYEGLNDRTRDFLKEDFLKERKPKRLEEGKTKFYKP